MSGESDRKRKKGLEERVRKVWHLDPFRMSVRKDGRFYCELEKPVEELTVEEARSVLEVLEELADRLRRRAEEEEG